MKNSLKYILVAMVATACVSTQADVTADFTGSADEASPATAANLNLGTTGGTWSGIAVVGTGGVSMNGEVMTVGSGGNATKTSTATLNFDSAHNLDGATFSFDGILQGFGGAPGQIYFDLFDGATQILRVSMSPDSGAGRGTVSHWSAVGGTRTGLTAEDGIWSAVNQTVNVSLSLGASDFSLVTTGGVSTNANSIGLAYFAGATSTSFNKLVITAVDNKAVVDIDNINIVGTPAAATPPVWQDPLEANEGINGVSYSDTLADKVSGTTPITFSLNTAGTWLSVAANGDLTGTPDTLLTNEFEVVAVNSVGSTTGTLSIVVRDTLPPVWAVTPVDGGSVFTRDDYGGSLDGEATDPDGNDIAYSLGETPTWLAVASSGALTNARPLEASDEGTNTFLVVADDGVDAPVTNTLEIVVIGPAGPVWNEDPFSLYPAKVGVPYSGKLAGELTEPDGDTITYAISSSAWLTVDPSTGWLSGTPAAGDMGVNAFTVTASDADDSDVATMNIEVVAAPANLLLNGSFEDGSAQTPSQPQGSELGSGHYAGNWGATPPTDWFINNPRTWYMTNEDPGSTADFPAGNYAMRIDAQVNGTPAISVLSQSNLVLTAGVSYDLSFYMWGEGAVMTRVDVALSGAADVTIADNYTTDGSDGEAEPVTLSFTPPASGTYAIAFFVDPSDGTSGHVWLDDLVLSSSTSPAGQVMDLMISGPVAGGMVLTWTSEDAKPYGVETNSNLIIAGDWKTFMTGLLGDGGTLSVTNPVGPDQTFYRVISEVPSE